MSIRRALGRSPKTALIIGAVTVAAAMGFGIFALGRNGGDQRAGGGAKAWFTDDDGKTQFVDDGERTSPFEHNGKKAYRCYVWTCDGGRTQFVGYLERLKPERSRAVQSVGTDKHHALVLHAQDMEVKPPLTGDRGWTEYGLPVANAIRTPHTPAGQKGHPTSVEPK